MNLASDRFVAAASLVTESAWLYAVCGMVGLMFGIGGSPLIWLAVLAILSSSLIVGRALNAIIMPIQVAYATQMVLGVIVLYLALGNQLSSGVQGIDLAWVGNLSETEGGTRRGVLAVVMALTLWWRGGRLASSGYLVDELEGSFRFGIVVLGVAAVVDVFQPADLNVFPMMFVFFAAGLAGLSIGHLLPASQRAAQQGTWPRVIAGVVSVVVVTGLLFSLLEKNVLAPLYGPVGVILGMLQTAIFFAFLLPLAFIVGWVGQGLFILLNWLSRGEPVNPQAAGQLGFEFLAQQEQEAEPAYLAIIGWTILAVIVLAALYLLAMAFRRRRRWRRVAAEGLRESVRGEADLAYDLTQLLYNMLPRRLKSVRRRRRFNLPEEDPGVVDVFRIYFAMLVMAEEKGYPRPRTATPVEYQRTLETILPARLVRMATAAFVRACYGHHPAPPEQIEEMRVSLEQLSAGGG